MSKNHWKKQWNSGSNSGNRLLLDGKRHGQKRKKSRTVLPMDSGGAGYSVEFTHVEIPEEMILGIATSDAENPTWKTRKTGYINSMSNPTPPNNEAEKGKSQELIPAYRDTVVHFLFGTPGHEPFLLHFLNAFLESDGQWVHLVGTGKICLSFLEYRQQVT